MSLSSRMFGRRVCVGVGAGRLAWATATATSSRLRTPGFPGAQMAGCARCIQTSANKEGANTAPTSARSKRSSLRASGTPDTPSSTPTLLPSAHPSFPQLHIAPFLCHRLEQAGIHRPTAIQSAVVPHLLRRPWDAAGYPDLIVQEMTGHGKTLAYLLPMLTTIDRSIAAVQAILVVPTRELAVQLTRVAQELGGNLPGSKPMPYPLAISTLVGQVNPTMLSSLTRTAGFSAPSLLADEALDLGAPAIGLHHPHILIGTPSVLHEIFVQRKLSDVHSVLPLDHLKYIVFDECDALLNSASSRNTLVPLINLRHQAVALELERVKRAQQELDETRDERRRNKKKAAEEERVLTQEEADELNAADIDRIQSADQRRPTTTSSGSHFEPFDPATMEVPAQPRDMAQQDALARNDPTSPHYTTAALTTSFPRNQVVLVSATVTTAVHQFAARFLGASRAFLTPQSIVVDASLEKKRVQGKDGSSMIVQGGPMADGSEAAQQSAKALTAPRETSIQRIPPHIKHYYLLVGRPYDRLNSLQQLLQAIKFQFEAWKAAQLMASAKKANGGHQEEEGSGDQLVSKATPMSAAFLRKHVGPSRAPSAGGLKPKNEVSAMRHLRGGVSAMGMGAAGHWKQATLVFLNQLELPKLVNPLSKQGFSLGVVSAFSGRHERREALRLEKTELLLATDVLARGMDLKSLTHVVNYAPPATPNLYLHRAGRVGRLGAVHTKIGAVVTLIDLEADPRALEHMAKTAQTLGIDIARLYVKKGKLFEDAAAESHITPEGPIPTIEAFIGAGANKKDDEADAGQEADETEKPKRTASQKPFRVMGGQPTKKQQNKSKREQQQQQPGEPSTDPAAAFLSTPHSASGRSASADSSAASLLLPLDPIASHLRLSPADFSSPRKLAELELAPQRPSKRRGDKSPDRQL